MPEKEGSCLGVRFYRAGHSAIRRLKHDHAPLNFGFRVWTASWVLMKYLEDQRLPRGLKVMEVGCGWGLAGIFCAKSLAAATTCVDADPEVFPFLRAHAELNQVEVKTLLKRFEDLDEHDLAGTDLLIGADICFWDEMSAPLLGLIGRALTAGVRLVLIADPGRSSFEELAARAGREYGGGTVTFSVRQPHPIQARLLRVSPPPPSR